MADIYDISSLNFGNTLDTDIGLMNMDKMITPPNMTSAAFNPAAGSMNGITMQGNLQSDKVELTTQKEKDNKLFGTLLKAAAVLGAGFGIYKFGRAGLSKLWSGIKTVSSKIAGKFKKP